MKPHSRNNNRSWETLHPPNAMHVTYSLLSQNNHQTAAGEDMLVRGFELRSDGGAMRKHACTQKQLDPIQILKKLIPNCSWFDNTSTRHQKYDIKYISESDHCIRTKSMCTCTVLDVVPSLWFALFFWKDTFYYFALQQGNLFHCWYCRIPPFWLDIKYSLCSLFVVEFLVILDYSSYSKNYYLRLFLL
jgi:hypothetical protein